MPARGTAQPENGCLLTIVQLLLNNHSMETKIKYAQQFNSFSTVLPGGGFHGGEQTDVLPGDNSNGDEKYGQATFTQKA